MTLLNEAVVIFFYISMYTAVTTSKKWPEEKPRILRGRYWRSYETVVCTVRLIWKIVLMNDDVEVALLT